MKDWFEDPWLCKAAEMSEEFADYHYKSMPEDPHEVWEETELGYFMDAFLLWNAQTKFKLKREYKDRFDIRVEAFHENIRAAIADSLETQDHLFDDDAVRPNFTEYLEREKQYMDRLMKASSSIFRAASMSIMNPACNLFLDKACKRFIFSRRDLTKIIGRWLLDKGVEIEKELEFD